MYKFSHIGIYGGDDDEKVSGRQDKRRGITVHGVAARASTLMQRFRNILEISSNADGPVKSADEVEGLVIEEMRRLGNATMGDWAASVEKRLGEELQQKEASARVRKKKR